jgi:predicted GNAT superfamily acetyltransferase
MEPIDCALGIGFFSLPFRAVLWLLRAIQGCSFCKVGYGLVYLVGLDGAIYQIFPVFIIYNERLQKMTRTPAIEIRQLQRREEFDAVVKLQRDIWGFEDVDLLPLRLFVVASKIGGQVLGAYAGSRMIAFCLCIPGLKSGAKSYLHSHMLGVSPDYRNTGLGRALKLKQRDYAIAAGVDLIEWTFDPLEIKNAFFNIERLGAIVRRYVHNQYGTTTSHLHSGLPTDRLVPEWWIRSKRVEAAAQGLPLERPDTEARISVPVEISELRRQDSQRAREIQADIGEQFDQCFRDGLAVIGFEKNVESGTYLLGKWELK